MPRARGLNIFATVKKLDYMLASHYRGEASLSRGFLDVSPAEAQINDLVTNIYSRSATSGLFRG